MIPQTPKDIRKAVQRIAKSSKTNITYEFLKQAMYAKCLACNMGVEAHDPTTGRCLFGPSVFSARAQRWDNGKDGRWRLRCHVCLHTSGWRKKNWPALTHCPACKVKFIAVYSAIEGVW